MKLSQLIAGCEIGRIVGATAVEVSGLAYDSRGVRPGDLFFATARDPAVARRHATQALDRGACAVVVRNGEGGGARSAATVVECASPRRLMGTVASRFFAAPSRSLDLIGVTGTSGKTTTTYLLQSIWEAAGRPAGIIGTIGAFFKGQTLFRGLTTPESADFEAALRTMTEAGAKAAMAEISSIGLAEHRVDELSFRAAVFTNLGRDHLDYHASEEAYFAAKLRLFTELLPRSAHGAAVALVNGDDPWGRRVLEAVRGERLSFGLGSDHDVRAVAQRYRADGLTATVVTPQASFDVQSPLLGEINLRNILGACAVATALGLAPAAISEGVRRCAGAPGRLQAVDGPPGVKVLVDYAHKPDALAAVLATLRPLCSRRLICVFGCGGDRDRGKRPLMGEIAGRLADITIVTNDNPRSEEPRNIIAEIEKGLVQSGRRPLAEWTAASSCGYIVEADRRAAIAIALTIAREGDIVVIAGKGHEDYQLIGNQRIAFDDRRVVEELTATIAG